VTDPDREAMHRLFAELRDADRRASPSFEAVLRRPRSPIASSAALSSMMVLAAVVVIAAVVVARRSHSVPAGPTLSAWQAPTDVLLSTPGIEVLRSVPSISSSILDKLNPSDNNQQPESQ
jgi:hypothetical protein